MSYQINSYTLKPDAFKQQLARGVIPWLQLAVSDNTLIDLPPLSDQLACVEEFIHSTDAYIYYGDDTDADDLYPACYIGATDTIGMPYPVQFFATKDYRGIVNYYGTLFHEIGHWTGHPKRLNRKSGTLYGSKAFALEELTAELTSVFVMNKLHITESPVLDEAKYLEKWQRIIAMFGDDKYSLTTAEVQASKACDYLFSLQSKPHAPQ